MEQARDVIAVQGAAELAVYKDGSLSPRCVRQSWHGTTIDGRRAPTISVSKAPVERCSDDEDPFGHGGALDAEEESGASTLRQRSEHEAPEEYHTNKTGPGQWCGASQPRDLVVARHHFLWGGAALGERQCRDLLTKACTYLAKHARTRFENVLTAGQEPDRSTVWPSATPV